MLELLKTSIDYSLRVNMFTAAIIFALFSKAQISMLNGEPDSLTIKKIEMLQVEFLEPGETGDDVIWKFPLLNPVRDYPVEYVFYSDSVHVTKITPDDIVKYKSCSDTLFILSTESPLDGIRYVRPIQLPTYPFTFTDHYEGQYAGIGRYCQIQQVDKKGVFYYEIDGQGTLILEDDTLSNVIRVHSMRIGSICIHSNEREDSLNTDEDMIKQEIEDKYEWFVEGKNIPVLETKTISYYDDMDFVSCIRKTICCLPEGLSSTDTEEDVTAEEDSCKNNNANRSQIIHYTISLSGSQVNISYSLDADADISVLICNHMGVLYYRDSFSKPLGEGYRETIDCSGLLPGTYILYMNVNGTVYNEKIRI